MAMFRNRSERHRNPDEGHGVKPTTEPTTPPPDGVVCVVDEANFEDRTAGGFTIVDFWAPWCAPCQRFRPVFHDVAARYAGQLRFGACNVDENPKIATLLQIRSIPTLVLFDEGGSEAGRVVGAPIPTAFEEMVREVAAHAARQSTRDPGNARST